MKKLFTLIALTAMLLGGVISANATKVYADLSKITHPNTFTANNAKWENNTIYWKASGNNVVNITGFSGDMSEYTNLVIKTSGLTEGAEYRLLFKIDGSNYIAVLNHDGEINIPLYGNETLFLRQWSDVKLTQDLLKNVEYFAIAGQSDATEADPSQVTIDYAYFTKPFSLSFDESGKAVIDRSDIQCSSEVTLTREGVLTTTGGGHFWVDLGDVDLSGLTNITVNATGATAWNAGPASHLTIKTVSDGNVGDWYSSRLGASVSAEQRALLGHATTLYWDCVGDDKPERIAQSMTISNIVLTSDVMVATKGGEVALNTLQYKNFNDNSNETATWNVKTSTDTYYGSGSSSASNYVDLSAYEKLRIYRSSSSEGFRAFFINAAGTGTNNITNANPAVTWNSEGYFEIDLSMVEKYDGKIYLNTIKSASYGVMNVVTNIVAYKTPAPGDAAYIISGSTIVTSSVTAALADASATLIDATGVTGTGVSLVSANPNCIVKANAGVLANANNVMVGNTIADLALTDGYPFAVPAGATATAATYTRAAGGTWGTICLPYAVASDANVQYYTLGENDGETLVIETADNVAAGTPAIFKNLSGNAITFTGSGALADNVDGSASTGTVLTMKGTYTQKVITAAADLAKTYYISGDEVKQATASLTINPFRAYMEAAGVAPARIALREANNTTAINALFNAENSKVKTVAVYGVNGAQQAGLQKGINIVKFSDGTSKKVILK